MKSLKKLNWLFVVVLFSLNIMAQPTTITYQGKLLDNNDIPLNQSNVPFSFAIYDAETNGNKIWPTAAFATKIINIDYGLYSVTLGTGIGDDDVFTATIFDGITPYLEVVVDGSVLPRSVLTNVPFALISNQLSEAGWASPGEIGTTTPNSAVFSDVTIGTMDPDPASSKLQVEGGVLFSGGNTSNSPGILFYDPASNGNFKYYDNNGNPQVLGTGDITYSGTLWSQSSGDYVASPDVICQGSLGVGLDMTPGFSFGFATIALRENNTRILFDDTSISSGFPANDWMLVANESANGGMNYFAIQNVTSGVVPFYVREDAGNNSLIVRNKKIGIGTNNPLASIHAISGNDARLILEQDNSLGNLPYSWAVAANDTSFSIFDNTAVTTPFKMAIASPSNSFNMIASGYIGLGVATPSHPLELASGAHVTAAGTWVNASDRRLKTNILESEYGLNEVLKLKPVSYNMISNNEKQVGFIAQDVKLIIPEVVSGIEGDLDKNEVLGISYGNLVPVLTKAIQEQQNEINNLKNEIDELKVQLNNSVQMNDKVIRKLNALLETLNSNGKMIERKVVNN